MSRELWLLRHGKSDRNIAMEDFDRPLKKRGKRAAERIGILVATTATDTRLDSEFTCKKSACDSENSL